MTNRKTSVAGTLTMGGVEYVIIPKAHYLRLTDAAPGAVDAHEFIRSSLGADLRAAREHAGLTQAELAERLGKSQTMVSQAESGTARISERYVRNVLAACGLPEDWNGSEQTRRKTTNKAPPRKKSSARGTPARQKSAGKKTAGE